MIGNLWRAVCRSACESRGGIGSTTKPRSDENNDTWIFADSATKPRYNCNILILFWFWSNGCVYIRILYQSNHNQDQDLGRGGKVGIGGGEHSGGAEETPGVIVVIAIVTIVIIIIVIIVKSSLMLRWKSLSSSQVVGFNQQLTTFQLKFKSDFEKEIGWKELIEHLIWYKCDVAHKEYDLIISLK